MKKKIVARIKGGLGNQLFAYAAARRLALINSAELVLDDVTGFTRDRLYRRRYALNHFSIPARRATPAERLEPFERHRRAVMRWWSRRRPFTKRRYLEQEGNDFDERLVALRVQGTLYLDGLWQSEGYFSDVEETIREDLRIIPPVDPLNHQMAEDIRKGNAVAVHVRWFDAPGSTSALNASAAYYQNAIEVVERRLGSPRYFLFSDHPEAATEKLTLPPGRVTVVSHNQREESGYADLWLMTQCQHFITANSTFSWWGAWLGGGPDKLVICPRLEIREGSRTAWNFSGQIPGRWLTI